MSFVLRESVMNVSESLHDLEKRISLLPREDQLALIERVAYGLRTNASRNFEASLAAMAADPDIQRELRAIEEEFRVTEADCLGL